MYMYKSMFSFGLIMGLIAGINGLTILSCVFAAIGVVGVVGMVYKRNSHSELQPRGRNEGVAAPR